MNEKMKYVDIMNIEHAYIERNDSIYFIPSYIGICNSFESISNDDCYDWIPKENYFIFTFNDKNNNNNYESTCIIEWKYYFLFLCNSQQSSSFNSSSNNITTIMITNEYKLQLFNLMSNVFLLFLFLYF